MTKPRPRPLKVSTHFKNAGQLTDFVEKELLKLINEEPTWVGRPCPQLSKFIKGELKTIEVPRLIFGTKDVDISDVKPFHDLLLIRISNDPHIIRAVNAVALYFKAMEISDPEILKQHLFRVAMWAITQAPPEPENGDKWIKELHRRLSYMACLEEGYMKGIRNNGAQAGFPVSIFMKSKGGRIKRCRDGTYAKEWGAYKPSSGHLFAAFDTIIKTAIPEKQKKEDLLSGLAREQSEKLEDGKVARQAILGRKVIGIGHLFSRSELAAKQQVPPQIQDEGIQQKIVNLLTKIGRNILLPILVIGLGLLALGIVIYLIQNCMNWGWALFFLLPVALMIIIAPPAIYYAITHYIIPKSIGLPESRLTQENLEELDRIMNEEEQNQDKPAHTKSEALPPDQAPAAEQRREPDNTPQNENSARQTDIPDDTTDTERTDGKREEDAPSPVINDATLPPAAEKERVAAGI